MATMFERQIRAKLVECVIGQISLEVFHEWLAPIIWDIENRNDPAAQDLAYSIELAIAEFVAGHRCERELIEELERLVLYESVSTGTSDFSCVGNVPTASQELAHIEHEGVFSSSDCR